MYVFICAIRHFESSFVDACIRKIKDAKRVRDLQNDKRKINILLFSTFQNFVILET